MTIEISKQICEKGNQMDKMQLIWNNISKMQSKLRATDMITLGEFIKELEKYPRDWSIIIEPFSLIPDYFCSYRGYYEDLCLTYTADWEYGEKVTVGDILDKAKNAVNKEFAGYKGGEFLMTEDTPLWVSKDYSCTGVTIAGFERVYDGLLAINCYKREE